MCTKRFLPQTKNIGEIQANSYLESHQRLKIRSIKGQKHISNPDTTTLTPTTTGSLIFQWLRHIEEPTERFTDILQIYQRETQAEAYLKITTLLSKSHQKRIKE